MALIQPSAMPDWGRLRVVELGSKWTYLSRQNNTMGRWQRPEGDVVVKGFADAESYRRGLAILTRVNHLPIFPRLLAMLDLETEDGEVQPGMALEGCFAEEWIDAGAHAALNTLISLPPAMTDKIASGLVTRLGLLHALGIARDPWEVHNEFFVHRLSGAIHLYDEENYREVPPGKNLDRDYGVSIDKSLRAAGYFKEEWPLVPMYEQGEGGGYHIPGDGRYVVTLGDVGGERSLDLAHNHHVELIDFSPDELWQVAQKLSRAESLNGSLRLTENDWQTAVRHADYVEAYYPVTGAEGYWRGQDGKYDPSLFLYGALLNKIRPGGIAFVISAQDYRMREWETLAKADPTLELLDVRYDARAPLLGGYARLPIVSWSEISACSYMIVRKVGAV